MMAGLSKHTCKHWTGQYDLAAVILSSSCSSMSSVTCCLSDFSILSDIRQKLTILDFNTSQLLYVTCILRRRHYMYLMDAMHSLYD